MFLRTSVYSNMIFFPRNPPFPPFSPQINLMALLELHYGSACSIANII